MVNICLGICVVVKVFDARILFITRFYNPFANEFFFFDVLASSLSCLHIFFQFLIGDAHHELAKTADVLELIGGIVELALPAAREVDEIGYFFSGNDLFQELVHVNDAISMV